MIDLDRHTGRQTDKQTDRQTQTNRQTNPKMKKDTSIAIGYFNLIIGIGGLIMIIMIRIMITTRTGTR